MTAYTLWTTPYSTLWLLIAMRGYLGTVFDEVALMEAEVAQVVRWRYTLRQALQTHLLQLQNQTQNFLLVFVTHLHNHQVIYQSI